MRIGGVTNEVGLAPETLRYYERRGLVPAPPRSGGGYREYSRADAERLRLLVGLRGLDVPLETAAKLATMCAAGRCDEVSDELRAAIPAERTRLVRRIRDLRELDARLALLEVDLDAGRRPRDVLQLERRTEDQ
jgi:DNA-binding transcriptional MerR regulator